MAVLRSMSDLDRNPVSFAFSLRSQLLAIAPGVVQGLGGVEITGRRRPPILNLSVLVMGRGSQYYSAHPTINEILVCAYHKTGIAADPRPQ